MSRYGTLRTWALELGLKDAAKLLQTTLDEEQATDIALTGIATSVVNQRLKVELPKSEAEEGHPSSAS